LSSLLAAAAADRGAAVAAVWLLWHQPCNIQKLLLLLLLLLLLFA
jgi:hypothetical protein